ncbi:MAG: chondroitinase-B domain-containing protein [Calditrichota bacterium]
MGEGKEGTGGIRVYGDDHVIINNYFEGLTGNTWDAPIALTNGDYDGGGSLSRHFRINRAIIAHNTLVENRHHIEIGFTNNGNYTKPPRDVKIWNNLVYGKQNDLVRLFTQPVNMAWEGNLMFADSMAAPGINLSEAEIRYADPLLESVSDLWKLSVASPAIDSAAVISLPVPMDMDGQSRDAVADIGADEFSTTTIIRRPLTPEDVGPFANDFVTCIGNQHSASSVTGFNLLPNYPNPFNPETTIRFSLERAAQVKIEVYNIRGGLVETLVRERRSSGSHSIRWNAKDKASGVYFVRLVTRYGMSTQKVMLLK